MFCRRSCDILSLVMFSPVCDLSIVPRALIISFGAGDSVDAAAAGAAAPVLGPAAAFVFSLICSNCSCL